LEGKMEKLAVWPETRKSDVIIGQD
jgi:hypothetical protein